MNRKIMSGFLAGIMAFSVSTAAFAAEKTVTGSQSLRYLKISNVISQQNYTINGEADTVYTIPIGTQITCLKSDGSTIGFNYAVFPDLASLSTGTDNYGECSSPFTITDDMAGKVLNFWDVVEPVGVICQVSSQKTNGTTSTKINSSKNYIIDTGAKLSVKSGKTYQFKITASTKPTFTCGNGSVFKVTYTGSKGHDYYFKATAIGKAGQATGFYVNGEKTPCTVGTVG